MTMKLEEEEFWKPSTEFAEARKVCDEAGLTNDDWDEVGGYLTASVAEALKQSYKKGLKKGIWLFAWWKDGEQYVGTCGTTLEKALKEVDKE